MEALNAQKSKLEKDASPPPGATSSTQKSFKIIKSYFDQQKSQTIEEKIQTLDVKLNSIISLFNQIKNHDEKSPRTSTAPEFKSNTDFSKPK